MNDNGEIAACPTTDGYYGFTVYRKWLVSRGAPATDLSLSLAFDRLENGIIVSTVFTGLSGHRPPMLFETAIFSKDGIHRLNKFFEQQEALDFHKSAVDLYKSVADPKGVPTAFDRR